jgi:hypothetical protein
MARRSGSGEFYAPDLVATAVEWSGSKLLIGGIIAAVLSTLILMYAAYSFGTGYITSDSEQGRQQLSDGLAMVRWGQIGVIIGLVAFARGMAISFWGDFALGLTLFLVALAYFTSTFWIEFLFPIRNLGPESYAIASGAVGSMALGGLILGILAVVLQIADISQRIKNRTLFGAKGDLMKYGSGVKEDYDYRNVFMGKCWQLPFCRKFVREQCPIYHSKRTCWRERVGCMCEEEVIRGAMEGNIIPKDAVSAAKYIPRNTKWTPAQKAERCRQCVIYNEHQRHKYRLAVPAVVLGVAFVYVMGRNGLLQWTMGLVSDFDRFMGRFTFSNKGEQIVTGQAAEVTANAVPGMLEEVVLFGIMLFILAQLMRLVEFCIFKLKI